MQQQSHWHPSIRWNGIKWLPETKMWSHKTFFRTTFHFNFDFNFLLLDQPNSQNEDKLPHYNDFYVNYPKIFLSLLRQIFCRLEINIEEFYGDYGWSIT